MLHPCPSSTYGRCRQNIWELKGEKILTDRKRTIFCYNETAEDIVAVLEVPYMLGTEELPCAYFIVEEQNPYFFLLIKTFKKFWEIESYEQRQERR